MSSERDYYGSTRVASDAPRKRQRRVKPVFMAEIGVPLEEITSFLNRVMRKEGFTVEQGRAKDPDGDEAHIGNAIVYFSKCGKKIWRVEAASDTLADKLCYLHRMPFKDKIIRVWPDRNIPNNNCKYSCWNEYYFQRYGENDNILDKEIIIHLPSDIGGQRMYDFLNERMKFHGLCEFEDRAPIQYFTRMLSPTSFVLQMSTPVEADRLCFLNRIQLGNATLKIHRSSDWVGPKPRFHNYQEFLSAVSDRSTAGRNRQRNMGFTEGALENTKPLESGWAVHQPSSSMAYEKAVVDGHRQRAKPVFVVDIGLPFDQIANYLNRVMRMEGFTIEGGRMKDPDGDDAHIGDAVTGYKRAGNGHIWCVTVATNALADKLCYLNRIPFDNKILRLGLKPYRDDDTRGKYSCWNEYHFQRYGRNDKLIETEIFIRWKHRRLDSNQLRDLLHEQMEYYGLCEFKQGSEAIKHIRDMQTLFILEMASPVEAERLCYLNGIQLGNTILTIERSEDWIGPEPQFKTYLDFQRARSGSNAAPRSQPTSGRLVSPSAVNENVAPMGSGHDAEARTADQSHKAKPKRDDGELRSILNALIHSNETKAKEMDSLVSELNALEKELSMKESEASGLQVAECSLNNEIAIANEKVYAIHDSWQAQALVLAEKQQEIEGLQQQLEQLRSDAKNVKESLLDESNESQALEAVLTLFASQPLSIEVLKKKQRSGATEVKRAVAASDDAFDI